MIDDLRIDCDEGFALELDGDFGEEIEAYERPGQGETLRIRLSQDAALKLYQQALSVIGPWALEGARELAAYRRATPVERLAVLGLEDDDETLGLDRGWPSRLLDHADEAKKRARGE